MSSSQFSWAVVIALLATSFRATIAQKKILAIVGSSSIAASHSQFFDQLRAAAFDVDIKTVKDKDLKLKEYDTFLYDSLIIFAPKASSKCSIHGWLHF